MNLINRIFFRILTLGDFQSILEAFKILLRSDRLDKKGIRELQAKKLSRLLKKAQEDVPYWRELLKSKNKTSSEELFKELPILNKAIIRKEAENMWSEKITEYIVATTGGTTGNPITIHRDKNCNAITKAALWRARKNWGIEPKDKTVYLNAFGTGTFKGKLKMGLARKRIGEAFPSSSKDVGKIQRLLKSFSPKSVEGFATGLLETAKKSAEKGDIKIPVVISTGEMLFPHQRELLQNAFSSKVYSYYGSNEIGSIAYECEDHRLHICEEHVLVETLDEEGKSVVNKPGRILVTDLDNLAMPFIRYDLGDVVTISDELCSCGRHSRWIKELQGRTQDFLSGENDTKLQGTQLVAYLKDLLHIGHLQFVQTNDSNINVLYDGDKEKSKPELEEIISHLKNRLGEGMQITSEHVSEIPKTRRGKQPLIVRKEQ